MNPTEFLSALFEGRGNETVLVWCLQTKRSHWLTHDLTLRLDDADDWYFGPGLAERPGSAKERVKADEIAGITALWADIDYADPVHRKAGLPSKEDAYKLCDAIAPASIIVHTGHGYQAYWLLDAPWLFKGDAGERRKAAALLQRWQAALAQHAKEQGWSMDATHDLSRVMRLPGTVNNKAEPVPVEVVRDDWGRRHSIVYLEALVADVALPTAPAPVAVTMPEIGPIGLSADARPPAEKWQALTEIEPAVLAVYTGQKRFASASERDLSLASYAVQAGWSDDEIVALLIAARRHHRDDLKLREDYYRRTLSRARSGHSVEDAPPADDPDANWSYLHLHLSPHLQGVYKVLTDPPQYHLSFEQGEAAFTATELLTAQSKVCGAVFGITDEPPEIKKGGWRPIVQALAAVASHKEAPGQTEREMFLEEIRDYYRINLESLPSDRKNRDAAALNYEPFVSDGAFYFATRSLQTWQRQRGFDATSAKDIARKTRLYLEGEAVRVQIQQPKTSHNYWRVEEARITNE